MFLLLNSNQDYGRIVDINLEILLDIAFVWFNVIVIVFILSWLLYRPVSEFLAKRRDRIAKDIEDAKEANRIAEENRAKYASHLAAIDSERDEILSEARKIASRQEEQIIADAKKEADLLLQRAQTEIERAQLAAKDEVRRQIVEVGSLIAEKFISRSIDEEINEKLLNEAIEEFQGGDKGWI